jgi:hypothetical protein
MPAASSISSKRNSGSSSTRATAADARVLLLRLRHRATARWDGAVADGGCQESVYMFVDLCADCTETIIVPDCD